MVEAIIELCDVSVRYGGKSAVESVSMPIYPCGVTAIIGPSGCGKSTLIRTINRTNEDILDCVTSGEIFFHGREIYNNGIDPLELRTRVGMVFQKPNPFPKTIFNNVAFGPRIHRYDGKVNERVEQSLRDAGLWSEVHKRLHENATQLSGGQQQRVCIARALTLDPEVLLMDEPCSALDPAATSNIEDLIFTLKKSKAIVMVTHNIEQARRVADWVAFMHYDDIRKTGYLHHFGDTNSTFIDPHDETLEKYIRGRFG